MEEIIKRKKILHEQLFSQNETFRQKKILQKEKNPFSTFSSIFTPTSFLSQNISRIRSSLYKRTSQKIGDITQRISNHNENNNFFLLKKTLLNNKRSSSCHLRNNSNLENMMINSKEKQIKPNLVSYLEFLDKKWKEMKKVKSEKIEEEIRKKQIGDFFSERKNYKLVAHKNQTQTQKQKIEKDISYLNLNCKQIFKKLMEVKRNELEIRNFKPNFEYSTTRKTKSFHKVNPKNFNFYEEDLSKRDELMETFLSIKKLK